jgi:dihydroorotate dehydrogenase (NAD+) catalytic subunit
MPDLSVKVGDLTLKNPLILGSGPCGRTALGLAKYVELGFAAVITKTITPEPVLGNPSPRDIVHDPKLLWESSGTPNMGFVKMLDEIKRAKDMIKGKGLIVVNITAEDPEDFARMAEGFEKAGADALEVAIFGCPNYIPGTKIQEAYWEQTPERIKLVVEGIKRAVKIPAWMKLLRSGIERIKACEEAGADLIHKFTIIRGVPIDLETGIPMMGNPLKTASCCGPFRRFEGIKEVMDISRAVKIPVVGGGGVWTGEDVIEYTYAGATGVQACSSIMLAGPKKVGKILEELEEFMDKRGINSLDEIRGKTLEYLPDKYYLPAI